MKGCKVKRGLPVVLREGETPFQQKASKIVRRMFWVVTNTGRFCHMLTLNKAQNTLAQQELSWAKCLVKTLLRNSELW